LNKRVSLGVIVLLAMVSLVAASQASITQLSTDKSQYSPGETVIAMASVLNQGNESIYNVTFSFMYFGPHGNTVCAQGYYVPFLAPGEGRNFSSTCNLSADAETGSYYLNGTMYGPGEILDSKGVSFQVVQNPVVSGKVMNVFTDKSSYRRGETVHTTAVIKNTGNVPYGGYVKFTYKRGSSIYATGNSYFSNLAPGALLNLTSNWRIPLTAKKGDYTVTAELFVNSTVLDSRAAGFSVR